MPLVEVFPGLLTQEIIMYRGKIPFDKQNQNSLMDYAGYNSEDNPYIEWKDNFIFYGTLRFVSTKRGRSAANFGVRIVIAQGEGKFLQGTIATMFMKQVLRTMQEYTIMDAQVSGRWTFYKQGQNYSIGPV